MRTKLRILFATLLLALMSLVVVTGPAQAGQIGTSGWEWPLGSSPTVVSGGEFLANGCGPGGTSALGGYGFYASGLFHLGSDMSAAANTNVVAIGPGTIKGTNSNFGGDGGVVFVEHTAADGSTFVALYGHLKNYLTSGTVQAGTVIGQVNTNHTHFGIHPGSYVSFPSGSWGTLSCSTYWTSGAAPTSTNGFVDPVWYLNAHPKSSPAPSPVLKADYNLSGASDIAAFYRQDNNVVDLDVWYGQLNGNTTNPAWPWNTSGWDGSRLIPAARDDFNGDGKQDIAAFYRHDTLVDLDIWYGDGVGNFSLGWQWSGNGWDGSRLIPAGAGDVNGDGKADIIAFYRHDNLLVDMRVWYGGSTSDPGGPWSATGWDGSRVIPVGVGDVNGDGKMDVSTFYRHDGGMMDQNIWYGDGTGAFTLGRPWHVDTGWDGTRFIPAGVADFNGDGKADTAAFYRQDNNVVDLDIWYGGSTGSPSWPWNASGWDGSRILPAGTGDFNGDGKQDIAAFYAHDGGVLDLDIWCGNGSGSFSLAWAWHNTTGSWEGARVVPVKG